MGLPAAANRAQRNRLRRVQGLRFEAHLNSESQVDRRPASSSQNLQLGEKQGHIRGRRRRFMKQAGQAADQSSGVISDHAIRKFQSADCQ